jgi:hypothetical protein
VITTESEAIARETDTAARAKVVVGISADAAWEKLSNLELAHKYVPGLVGTEITTQKKSGIGTSRKVYRSPTDAMDETVVEWEDGRGFVLRLHYGNTGAPAPFRRAWFRYWIEDGNEEQATLSLTLGYEMRWGVLGRLLQLLGTNWFVQRQVSVIAKRLAQYYETGSAEGRS